MSINEVIKSEEEFFDVIMGDHPDFEFVVNEKIIDSGRWHLLCKIIVKEKETDKFYAIKYTKGATEYQDIPFSEMDINIEEVEPYEVKVIKYRKKVK